MSIAFDPNVLTYTDESQTHLTRESQEHLKGVLTSEALKMAVQEKNAHDLRQSTCNYYYNELAQFMIHNPQVMIDLGLLKPDLSEIEI